MHKVENTFNLVIRSYRKSNFPRRNPTQFCLINDRFLEFTQSRIPGLLSAFAFRFSPEDNTFEMHSPKSGRSASSILILAAFQLFAVLPHYTKRPINAVYSFVARIDRLLWNYLTARPTIKRAIVSLNFV